ncbi:HIT family protein [Mycoplasmopsis ciconiae]|uniref:HIT family protein n=1 Tax=Mycoplasmopsis ciconiae TaxID=561067 RepID=A0ABU7ML68_9BACT|nr:HIT family protein [Mycoplasmopsis ciconiae]
MNDIFLKIINREIPADIVYEDERVIAFKDIQPVQPGHFLVVPKKHSKNCVEMEQEDFTYLLLKARELANNLVLQKQIPGFQLIINTGSSAGQTVFHTHVHIIPFK